MESRGEKPLKEILKESLQHLPRLLTFCNIGAPGADTGRRWGAPLKFAKNGKEERERKKRGKETKEEEREEEKEKREKT